MLSGRGEVFASRDGKLFLEEKLCSFLGLVLYAAPQLVAWFHVFVA